MAKQSIRLSDHFTYGKLLRFTLPSICMMVFTSIYGVVDGLFVSNFVGKTPFAAVNLVMPFVMILGGMGFMIGTGGTRPCVQAAGRGQAGGGPPHLLHAGTVHTAVWRSAVRRGHHHHARRVPSAGRV